MLYGIGARLDSSPELLFKLRGVDETELLANADRHMSLKAPCPAGAKVLDADDAAALFGLQMAEQIRAESPADAQRQPTKRSRRPDRRARTQVAASKKRRGRHAPVHPPGSPSAVSRRRSKKHV